MVAAVINNRGRPVWLEQREQGGERGTEDDQVREVGGGSQITQGLVGHSKDLGFTLNEMGGHCRVWSRGVMT